MFLGKPMFTIGVLLGFAGLVLWAQFVVCGRYNPSPRLISAIGQVMMLAGGGLAVASTFTG